MGQEKQGEASAGARKAGSLQTGGKHWKKGGVVSSPPTRNRKFPLALPLSDSPSGALQASRSPQEGPQTTWLRHSPLRMLLLGASAP